MFLHQHIPYDIFFFSLKYTSYNNIDYLLFFILKSKTLIIIHENVYLPRSKKNIFTMFYSLAKKLYIFQLSKIINYINILSNKTNPNIRTI
ncbi:Cell division protein FtsN [Buchnera aphidicola (Anoecia corni)]|uniref:Cell division protein FtsN, partial n=1 Tax=Buchnera aphidicola (Anoecia corni) TaxID=2994477 RepID=A0AAT9IHH3_9GAMM